MATNVREFRDSAASLCRSSWCPACCGRVYPELQTRPDTILCVCERCATMLVARDLGRDGEYLTLPDEGEWKLLLHSHGREIAELKRAINLPAPEPEPEPAPEPMGEVWAILSAALAVFCVCVWLAWSFVKR